MTTRRFEVFIGGRQVEIVYFDEDMSAREVRRTLIEHDNMPNSISVYKSDSRGVNFDDVSRATHPGEH